MSTETAVHFIPQGYRQYGSYLTVKDATAAMEFYSTVLGAKERMRMPDPAGRIMHAEMDLGDGVLMLSDACPEYQPVPDFDKPSPVTLHLYVPDVDAVVAKAQAAGATVVRPPNNEFYGDRVATVQDPFGHRWMLATHIEDVTPEMMQQRMDAMMQQMPGNQ